MYINNRIKKIIIAVIVIFFILTIAVFNYNQNKNYNEVKSELLTNTWTSEFENEYKLEVISNLQYINNLIPETELRIKEMEEELRIRRLRRRCLEYELERITTNKWYSPWFCDNKDNLEQFKVTKQVEAQTAQTQPKVETVVF